MFLRTVQTQSNVGDSFVTNGSVLYSHEIVVYSIIWCDDDHAAAQPGAEFRTHVNFDLK